MARLTISDVKTTWGITDTYDIVNAIRNDESGFHDYIPLANAENVAEVGAAIMGNPTVQNQFINSLVSRIGLVVIRSALLQNPLKKFKKGQMPQGYTIEEIFVDITRAHKYDPERAEQEVYKRETPDVKVLFHEQNRREFYKQTIHRSDLKMAFVSWGKFENFITKIINSMYSSAEVDEFKYMKLLIDNYYSKGLFNIVPVNKPDTETNTREFVKKVRAMVTKMTLPQGSRDYNSLAVHTRSDLEGLHLFIDADLNAELDVDVLAKAFNLERSTFLANVTVIDGFASSGLEAVLVDRDFFMVYDVEYLVKMKENEEGLYYNYWLHVWQILSTSRFANAVAFVSGDVPPVTQVIVDPVIASVRQGREQEFSAIVRQTDNEAYDITWSVEADRGSSLASGTTINADGVLTVGETQTGTLVVKATTSYETEGEEPTSIEVVGESVVSVIENI